ncbi:MAG: bifunctional folylpolyglutamate synthase/dihydrofolate synthase [Sphingobacteriales bacterium]|nr:MAG: bifunctional folylpolyglutamate synthase/dihydrofolate synthase [Sphingobacteriales bacterium]
MFTRIGAAAYKADLFNTLALCAALGNPEQRFRSVHIAGTNGKGSTSTALAAFLQAARYKTALYTSPHLVDFRERIRINGAMIPESFVVDFTDRMQPMMETIQPSFFELTVAMAFEWFAQEQVDIAVIETGLGGRLDSTNVITPMVSVITNIALDHTALLGDTRTQIAGEKAGIIKPGVPVIIGERDAATEPVFRQKAALEGSPIHFAEDCWQVAALDQRSRVRAYEAVQPAIDTTLFFEASLSGTYQQQNLATVFTTLDILASLGLSVRVSDASDALADLSQQGLRGRYEILQEIPLIVADVAHNPQGLEAVLQQWTSEVSGTKHVVLGFVRDKDVAAALSLFPKDAHYHFCQADIPRALPVAELAAMGTATGLSGTAYPSVVEAVAAAKSLLGTEDSLLITGSFFIVGEALTGWETL